MTIPPPAVGSRLRWAELPQQVRDSIEQRLGASVLDAASQAGGFSPGVASRLVLSDGTRAFLKVVGTEPNPDSPAIHRQEARVAAALPAELPAPRLIDSFELDGWVALLFTDIDGAQPDQPWRPDQLARVLDALAELAEALTPAPIAAPTAGDQFGAAFYGWRRLADRRQDGEDLADLDPWVAQNLPRLTELEAGWEAAAAGDCLAHADIRADNLLLTPDAVYLVDWPWACLAQPWFDLLGLLPSIRMQGGPLPQTLFDDHPVAANADPAAVDAVLAALAGYWLEHGRRPAPPGLPTLREFQRAQGLAALAWLRHRLD